MELGDQRDYPGGDARHQLVLNHTSDKHPWFLESKSSRTNPKADWYVWHDGKEGGKPPNNWTSGSGGSSWQWVAERGQFYYHNYYIEQPDLNWRNPEVRAAVFDMLRFWLKRGVSGFRLDGISNLYEDALFRDESVLPEANAQGPGRSNQARIYRRNLPETYDAYRALRKVADEFPGSVLVGQVGEGDPAEFVKAYGENHHGFQLPIYAQYGAERLFATEFRRRLRDVETGLRGNIPLLVFDSHDRPRSWTRYADGAHDLAIAKLLATLLLAPRGAALVYYGQELGMENSNPKRVEDVRDPPGKLNWPRNKGRDGERTPMQWSAGPNAGFSPASATTWLPVSPSYVSRNAAAEAADPNSLFNYYKALIRLRKENLAVGKGEFALVNEADENVLSWTSKTAEGAAVLVALNLSAATQTASFDMASRGLRGQQASTLLNSFLKPGEAADLTKLVLPPYGAFVGTLK